MFGFGLTVWYVWIGTVLAAMSAACIGTFAVLHKRALAGDAVAHAVLPGLCVAFAVVGEKWMGALLLGAFVAGMLAFWALDVIPAWSKLKQDTATALVLSLFFGVGLLLLTHIQHGGNAEQAGLEHFLFGNAASMQVWDVVVFAGVGVMVLVGLGVWFRGCMTLVFDEGFAAAIGYPVVGLGWLLRVLLVMAIIVGMYAVGVVLMTAMLVMPAVAARCWTGRLRRMVVLSAVLAGVAATLGTVCSYQVTRLPTGPCIVLAMAGMTLFSLVGAPQKGWIAKRWAKYRYRKKVVQENILKLMHTLNQECGYPYAPHGLATLLAHYPLHRSRMEEELYALYARGLVRSHAPDQWALTPKGSRKGKQVHRLHLLWEAYLVHYLHVAPDHVHEDAESIEHLLTPALCADLEKLVGHTI